MPIYDPGTPAPKRKPAPYNPYPNGRYRDYDPADGSTTYYPGGTGSGNPPVSQGPPAAPAPSAPAPPPAPIDWGALIQGDPSYIAKIAELTRLRHDAVVNFGDATGIAGADAATAAEAANNPYSVTSMLRQQLASNQHNLTNNANAHGVLFSGAADQNRSNEANAGVQRQFDATRQLQAMLGGYGDQQQQAYADAYNRLASNPPVSPVTTDPATAAPAAAAAVPAAVAPAPAHGLSAGGTAPWAKPPSGFKGLPTGQLFSTQPAARNKVKLPKGPLPARYG
jgi:hypothetical protein